MALKVGLLLVFRPISSSFRWYQLITPMIGLKGRIEQFGHRSWKVDIFENFKFTPTIANFIQQSCYKISAVQQKNIIINHCWKRIKNCQDINLSTWYSILSFDNCRPHSPLYYCNGQVVSEWNYTVLNFSKKTPKKFLP